METRRILVIAGSDSSGGAGLEADQKVIAVHQCYAMTATTALTAQNTQGVLDIHYVPSAFVSKQIDACIDDLGVDVVKIGVPGYFPSLSASDLIMSPIAGMLASAETVDAVARALERHGRPTCVLDPVMVATTGAQLLPNAAVTNVRIRLLPLTTVLTPNLSEARLLLENAGIKSIPEINSAGDLVHIATLLKSMGPKYVLIKGGHLPFNNHYQVPQEAETRKYVVDVLHTDDKTTLFITDFSHSKNTHGTGCSLASAIASNLARGDEVPNAVEKACRYVETGIKTSASLGHGSGPINHFHSLEMAREPPCESSLRVRDWNLDKEL
ncbi:MAG: hypothetical protein LQ339_002856 [Xanthoria mediterranea]|nr:MAG: hypothetical protein LQ339_002856 [Xanthoria mediterranea]